MLENTTITDTMFGSMTVYSKDLFISGALILYGEYCAVEVFLLKNASKTHGTILDIGANIGFHTRGFSEHFSQVISFEPNSTHYKMLTKNITDKNNVTTHNVACGSSIGKTFIESFDTNKKGNFGKIFTGVGDTQVDCVTIDSLELDECDAVKIDTEGYEYECLLGANQTIDKFCPTVLFEYNTGAGDNCIEYLKSKDYGVWKFSVRNYNPQNWKKNTQNVYLNSGVVNCIAIPNQNGIERINHAGFVLC